MTDISHDASATIGAREFHEKTGVTNQLRDVERAFKEKYTDPTTGKVLRKYVRRRKCPLCDANDGAVTFSKNGFDHLRCKCGMIYVGDILKEEYLNLVYDDDQYEEETHRSFRTEPRKSFILGIYQEGLDLIKKSGSSSGDLLDIGCSSGLFMEYAAERGFSVKGIEPSRYAVDIAQSCNLDVTMGYFKKELFTEESFSIITLWDVLEHCEDPKEIIDAAFHVLAPGGRLFIQVPNAMGLAPRILKQDCNMFTGFGHVNLFGPETLRSLLEPIGYRDISMKSVISEISVINNYLNYHDPYFGPSTEKEFVFGTLDVDTITKNLWGYKLQVVAIKDGSAS